MHVLKFGGTSMGDEKTWHQVLDIIRRYDHPIIVVSATARTTRQLLSAADTALQDLKKARSIAQAVRERHERLISNFMTNYPDQKVRPHQDDCLGWINDRTEDLNRYLEHVSVSGSLTPGMKDAVASVGEQLSSYLFVQCGLVYGLDMQWIDARRVIKTNSEFGKAEPDTGQIDQTVCLLTEAVKENYIPVMGGYYGEDEHGNITTLGFEGSDVTASLVGAALDARAIEIWTDVSGVFTCDPRFIPEARSIRELSFQEATELAYFGAKVLHPSTMKPASRKQIPIYVKNIFDAGHPGTKIHMRSASGREVKAITFIDDVVIITVTSSHVLMGYQFLSEVFAGLEEMHLPVDVVTTTEASVSVALEASPQAAEAGERLKQLGEVSLTEKQALISLIGCTFRDTDTITKKILSGVSGGEISMLSYSQAKNNLNLVLPRDRLQASVRGIHAALFE